MKRIFLPLVCCAFSWLSSFATVGEHATFSIYHHSSDSAHEFRVKMKTDGDAYWDGTSYALNLYQLAIRFPDGISVSVRNSGLPFTSGKLSLLSVIDDPTNTAFSLRRLYYDSGYTAPNGGTWAKNTEYDLAILIIKGYTASTSIQLAHEDAQLSGNYIYAQLNDSDYVANYTTPFYGDTSAPGGWDYADISGSPLPVALAEFTVVTEKETDARLTWVTVTEENNRGFHVERSPDGQSWEVIDLISSQATGGNSDIHLEYEYTDANVYKPWTGISTYYYRLRQQDMNGEEEFVGGIKAVRFSEMASAAQITVYPNPAASFVNVKVEGGIPSRCMIYDMSGKCLLSNDPACRLDVSGLAKGIYQFMVTDITGACLGSQKLIIAR